MCTEAFDYMDLETLSRLCESGLLTAYSIGIFIYCISTLRLFLSNASVVAENSETEKFLKIIQERDFESSYVTTEWYSYHQYREVEERAEYIDQDGEDFPNMTFEDDGMHERSKEAAVQTDCNTSPNSFTEQVIKGRPDLVFYLGKHNTTLIIKTKWVGYISCIKNLQILFLMGM